MVTGFVVVRIHPSTPLTVPTLFLLWLFGHLYGMVDRSGIGENGSVRHQSFWLAYTDVQQ